MLRIPEARNTTEISPVLLLPDEVLIHIFTFNSPRAVLSFKETCKSVARVCMSDPLWDSFMKLYFKRVLPSVSCEMNLLVDQFQIFKGLATRFCSTNGCRMRVSYTRKTVGCKGSPSSCTICFSLTCGRCRCHCESICIQSTTSNPCKVYRCAESYNVCVGCWRKECQDHEEEEEATICPCVRCSEMLCERCGRDRNYCSSCDSWTCANCASVCSRCECLLCYECSDDDDTSCSVCHVRLCWSCNDDRGAVRIFDCQNCPISSCNKCVPFEICEACGEYSCCSSRSICECCGGRLCANCLESHFFLQEMKT